MIAMDLYNRVEGLQGEYVQGDYEDSDLCLRLMEEGYENWYIPNAELYHLEGQSYAPALRQLNTRYNTWLQSHRWDARIGSIMTRYASPADEGAVANYPGAAKMVEHDQDYARASVGAAQESKQPRHAKQPARKLDKGGKRRSIPRDKNNPSGDNTPAGSHGQRNRKSSSVKSPPAGARDDAMKEPSSRAAKRRGKPKSGRNARNTNEE
jgi:hypothetical protein